MKVKYDQEVDVLRIRFSSAAVDESDEEKPGSFWTTTETGTSSASKF
jgi:Protein of unknown function (DUF2283)